MVFTEQQLQVKKLVDVQQDIEIDALNDSVGNVNSTLSETNEQLSTVEQDIENLKSATEDLDNKIESSVENLSNSFSTAISDSTNDIFETLGTQVTTAKVTAGEVTDVGLTTTTPIEANTVVGYDENGKLIPVHAVYDNEFPEGATFLKTDGVGNVVAGVPESTVNTSDNVVSSNAVKTAIDAIDDSLSDRIDAIEQGQSLPIYNTPADNQVINVPNMKCLMYDPITNKVYWSNINIVPPMTNGTSGQFLTNVDNVPTWQQITIPNYQKLDGEENKNPYMGYLVFGAGNKADTLHYLRGDGTWGTIHQATDSTLGAVKSATTGTTANRDYNVEVKNDGTMKTNVPWEDTHYSAALKAGPVDTTSNGNTTNTNTYLKVVENDTLSSQLNIKGTKGVVVTSDTNGVITIEGQGSIPILLTSGSYQNWDDTTGYLVLGPGYGNNVPTKYLAGDGQWYNIPVPSQTSSDSGKVLQAGGDGTTSWTNLPASPLMLSTSNNDPNAIYGVKGANNHATSNYYLDGTGNWSQIPANELPSQTSQSGKYLKTNGTSVSWENIPVNDSTVIAGDSDDTTNGTTTNTDTYVGIVNNGARTSGIQLQGTGAASVSAASGVVTINATVPDKLDSSHYDTSAGYLVKGPGSDKKNTNFILAGDGTWISRPSGGAISTIVAGGSNSGANQNTTNTHTYLQVVEGGSVTSQLNIKGTKGVTVSSSSSGVITIEGQGNTPVLLTAGSYQNWDDSTGYLVLGPGYGSNDANHYLAGNGYWYNGKLVPAPTSSDYGKSLKCDNSGNLYWG